MKRDAEEKMATATQGQPQRPGKNTSLTAGLMAVSPTPQLVALVDKARSLTTSTKHPWDWCVHA